MDWLDYLRTQTDTQRPKRDEGVVMALHPSRASLQLVVVIIYMPLEFREVIKKIKKDVL